MSRRGFALLAVLWMLAAVTAAIGGTLAVVRVGEQATANRLVLVRGRWAAEACLAIASARWGTAGWAATDTVDLGRGTRCLWKADDPTARLNLNLADRAMLLRFLNRAGVPEQPALRVVNGLLALRRQGPIPSVDAVAMLLPGRLLMYLTTDGPGVVNAAAAAAPVLAALPGMTDEAVEVLVRRRMAGRPVTSLEALAAALTPPARAALLSAYADLARLLVFSAPQLQLTAQGWVASRGDHPRATIELLVVPLPARLAVVRRRMS